MRKNIHKRKHSLKALDQAPWLAALFLFILPMAANGEDNTWRKMPIMVINTTPEDVPNLAHLVDVVSYYTSFTPFDATQDLTQEQADRMSFQLDSRAKDMIDAVTLHGLHATVTAPLFTFGSPPESGHGVLVGNDLYLNPDLVVGCEDPAVDPAGCILVPKRTAEVTSEYVEYWASKLPNFLTGVDQLDVENRVWAIYGTEEIRHWHPDREYDAQRRLRTAIDDSPLGSMPLVAYAAQNRMPESMAWTLVAHADTADAAGSLIGSFLPDSPRTFSPVWAPSQDPCHLIGPGCEVTDFDDYYPLEQSFGTGPQGGLLPMQNHLIRGSYLGHLLGDQSHTNRIASIHRMDAQLETLANVRELYTGNGQHPPRHLAFHAPDLTLCPRPEAQTTAAEARHDFWSGLHRGQGVFIYNYNFVVQARSGAFSSVCPTDPQPQPQEVLTIWQEYEHALRLLKSGLRRHMVLADKQDPVVFSNVIASVQETIPGTDYLIDNPIEGAQATFAMPDYPALNGSSYTLGNETYLLVTSSYDQRVSFTLPFVEPICSIQVVHGSDDSLSFNNHLLKDSFSGIDGRVYRIRSLGKGGCD